MDQHKAFQMTLELARRNRMDVDLFYGYESCSYEHIAGMWRRVDDSFSDAKLGRWLGWAQACVVAAGYATLEDMKNINKECK